MWTRLRRSRFVGNREQYTGRDFKTTDHVLDNEANEYATIDSAAVTYDAAGNLTGDEDGRQYIYDELNRLTQVRASDDAVLANYTYDAFGRRIVFEDPVAGVTARYYYDGRSVIEERDGTDARVRYHVNGAQYIDERVATYDDSTGEFEYYLLGRNFSVVGTGNADGTVIEPVDYSASGNFAVIPADLDEHPRPAPLAGRRAGRQNARLWQPSRSIDRPALSRPRPGWCRSTLATPPPWRTG